MANEKNMNPVFSIKNFRSFGEEGADFELAPITVLTGCNSAGKSSLVKAMLLLGEQSKDYPLEIPASHFLELTKIPRSLGASSSGFKLGGFNNILHDGSNDTIEISYTVASQYLQENVRVKRRFRNQEGDILYNGVCDSYNIEKVSDGGLIYGDTLLKSLKYPEAITDNFKEFESRCKKIEPARQRISTISILPIKTQEMAYIWEYLMSPEINAYQLSLFWDYDRDNKKDLLKLYAALVHAEVVFPYFLRDVSYVNSESAKIKRIYTTDDDDRLSLAIRKCYEMPKDVYSSIKPFDFCNKWIEKFGIGEKIIMRGILDGAGVALYLEKNGKERLLADEGYGITQLVSLLLTIENKIHTVDSIPGKPLSIAFGKHFFHPRYVYVEEPEIHLHPKYQSLLADMFVEAYKRYNIRFIIETHSEYLIRKLQLMVADGECSLAKDDVSINYIEKNDEGVAYNKQIKILPDGSLSDTFGKGFYDEALELAVKLYKKKTVLS